MRCAAFHAAPAHWIPGALFATHPSLSMPLLPSPTPPAPAHACPTVSHQPGVERIARPPHPTLPLPPRVLPLLYKTGATPLSSSLPLLPSRLAPFLPQRSSHRASFLFPNASRTTTFPVPLANHPRCHPHHELPLGPLIHLPEFPLSSAIHLAVFWALPPPTEGPSSACSVVVVDLPVSSSPPLDLSLRVLCRAPLYLSAPPSELRRPLAPPPAVCLLPRCRRAGPPLARPTPPLGSPPPRGSIFLVGRPPHTSACRHHR